jgi:hypothetical protein
MNQQEIPMNNFMSVLFSGTAITPILVGSRAYNAHKPESDYDYAFLDGKTRNEVVQQCQNINIDYIENITTGALKFNFEGKIYNFIFLNEIDYRAWYDATEIMKIISESFGIAHLRQMSKNRRLSLFGPLVNKFGGTYTEYPDGTSS